MKYEGIKITSITEKEFKKALESEDWLNYRIKDRAALQNKYARFLDKIKNENKDEQLRLYQLAMERLLEDKRSHRISDDFAENALQEVQVKISGITGKLSNVKDKRKNPHSDRQKEIAQKYLIKNWDVLKDQYNGNQNPFVKEKVIPHIIKKLGISKDDCLSSRQLCQTLVWNKSK